MTDTHSIVHLVNENKRLKEELSIAQQWIGREVSAMHLRKRKEETMDRTRKNLQESEEEIQARIKKYLGEYHEKLGEENRDLLIESELNFYHLVRKKDMDGLMVTNVYQKILENIFEEHWTRIFREKYKRSKLHPKKNDILEKTLYKVIHDDFRLSLGKIYQLTERIISDDPGDLISLYRESIESTPLAEAMNDAEFWEYFSDVIETQAFGGKRHAGKISFHDVEFIRESVTGNYGQDGLLKILLKYV